MTKWTERELIAAGYTIQNAKIINAYLSTGEHCTGLPIIFDCNRNGVVYGGAGVIYGGYILGKDGIVYKADEIEGSVQGMKAILYIMHIVEVNRLDDIKGKYVRIATIGGNNRVKIIGNIFKDEWFDYDTFEKKGGSFK